MNNRRLILMITDQERTRYINIHSIFRQVGLYALIFLAVCIVYGIVSVRAFKDEIVSMSALNAKILAQYEKTQEKNAYLNSQIEQRSEEIGLVGDRVEDLESIIGVGDAQNTIREDLRERIDVASLTGAQKVFVMKFVPNGYPLDYYKRISADFGYRIHPLYFTKHLHTGIDFATDIGTPVYATADGVVEFAQMGYNGGFGNLVKLDHSFGFRTYYAHLNKIVVTHGSFVKKGQLIAYSGNSGASTGPHLHYEVRFLGNVLDPKNFIEWTMSDFSSIFENERNVSWQSLLTTINSLMGQVPPQEEQQSSPTAQE
ncbi:M23 family metallopeptidase [uncultured Helicobacter sp.]|uniref:M23 family metallopeptidase n=1 Tax=uncultured Helicobacter sp. TaxID=175537 RepID=UPI00374F5FF7